MVSSDSGTETKDTNSEGASLPSSLRPTFEYWCATTVCRLWMTVLMALVGLFWAENIKAFLIFIASGFVLDIIRNFTAPDLKLSPEALVNNFARVQEDQLYFLFLKKKYKNKEYVFASIPVLYVFTICIFDYFIGTKNTIIYFSAFSALHDLFWPFIAPLREHFSELTEIGYGGRAILAAHIYFAVFVLFLFSSFILSSGSSFYHSLYTINNSSIVFNRMRSDNLGKKILRNPAFGLCFSIPLVIFFFLVTLVPEIKADNVSYNRYRIQTDNYPFVFYSLFFLSIIFLIFKSYSILVWSRIRGCGAWVYENGEIKISRILGGSEDGN